jgi:hypothetical protein
LKGYVVGPFDFLNAFYEPFRSIEWKNLEVINSARHYKNYLLADVLTVVWPQKLLAIEIFKSGKFPLWNPYMLNGTPFLANIQSSVLYPLNILFFVFNKVAAFNIYILSQFIMAFGFMFLFLKRILELGLRSKELGKTKMEPHVAKALRGGNGKWKMKTDIFAFFGAMSFAFCSFIVGWSTWGTLGHAILWLPLVLYYIEKYFENSKLIYGCLITIFLTFSIFAGHTQTTTMVYLISGIYILMKAYYIQRDCPPFAKASEWQARFFLAMTKIFGFMVLSLLMASIQLIPAIEMYRNSARELASGTNFYYDQTLYLTSYLAGIFPDIFGNPVTRNWWGKINYAEAAIYFGTTSFYFMIYSLISFFKKDKPSGGDPSPAYGVIRMTETFAMILIVLGMVLSTQNPISKLIFDLKIPLFSSNTFARYSMIYIFGGIVLSTVGFSQLIEDIKNKHFKTINLNNLIFIIFLGLLGILVLSKFLPKDFISNLEIIKRNAVFPVGIILTLIISTFFYTKRNISSNYLNFLIITLLLVESFRFTNKFIPVVSSELFFPNHSLIVKLQELTKDGRYHGYLPNNINVLYRVSGFDGGEPLYNKNLAEIVGLSNSNIPQIEARGALGINGGKNINRIFDLLSIKYFVDDGDGFRNDMTLKVFGGDYKKFDERYRLILSEPKLHIFKNNFALENERLCYSYIVPKNKQEMFDALVDKNFDVAKTIFLEKNIGELVNRKSGTVIKTSENETEKKFFVDSPRGILVLSDVYYPGWRVYVNDEERELLKVDNTFMGVVINEGKSNVQFIYNSNTVKLAAIMSFVGVYLWGFLAVFGLVEIWKRK